MRDLRLALLSSFALLAGVPGAIADEATPSTPQTAGELTAEALSQTNRVSLGTFTISEPTRPAVSQRSQTYAPQFSGYAPSTAANTDLKFGTVNQFSQIDEYPREVLDQDPHLGFTKDTGNFVARLKFNWPRRQ